MECLRAQDFEVQAGQAHADHVCHSFESARVVFCAHITAGHEQERVVTNKKSKSRQWDMGDGLTN